MQFLVTDWLLLVTYDRMVLAGSLIFFKFGRPKTNKEQKFENRAFSEKLIFGVEGSVLRENVIKTSGLK